MIGISIGYTPVRRDMAVAPHKVKVRYVTDRSWRVGECMSGDDSMCDVHVCVSV